MISLVQSHSPEEKTEREGSKKSERLRSRLNTILKMVSKLNKSTIVLQKIICWSFI